MNDYTLQLSVSGSTGREEGKLKVNNREEVGGRKEATEGGGEGAAANT